MTAPDYRVAVAERCRSRFWMQSGAVARCVFGEGHVGRTMAAAETGQPLEEYACHSDTRPTGNPERLAFGAVVWWDHQQVPEGYCTCLPAPDTSIIEEQAMDLASVHRPHVAAVLAAVLVGRHVRAERPHTEHERVLYPVLGMGGTYGGELVVSEVRVLPTGVIRLIGDGADTPIDVEDPAAFTWTVLDEREAHPLRVAHLVQESIQAGSMSREKAEAALGLTYRMPVTGSGAVARAAALAEVVERWMDAVEVELHENGASIIRFKNDMEMVTQALVADEDSPASPSSEPGSPASPVPDGTTDGAVGDGGLAIALTGYGLEDGEVYVEWEVSGDLRSGHDVALAVGARVGVAPKDLAVKLIDNRHWLVRMGAVPDRWFPWRER